MKTQISAQNTLTTAPDIFTIELFVQTGMSMLGFLLLLLLL